MAVAAVPRRSVRAPTASATTERSPSAPTTSRASWRTGSATAVAALDADHPTGAVADDARDARAVVERRAGRAGGVDEDRIEHRAAGRVEGVDTVGRLDRDPHLLVGERERRRAHRRSAGGDDVVEHAPAVELHDPQAHQGVGRQRVGPVSAAVDDEHVETGAGEEHRGGGAGGAGADDDDVVAWSERGVLMTRPCGSAKVQLRRWPSRLAMCDGDVRGVVADAVDEVRVAPVLEALPDHVETGDGGDAAPLDDLAVGAQDGNVQPRVRAAVAGGPHDRGDAVPPGVEPRDRLGREEFGGRDGGENLTVEAGRGDVVVDAREQPGEALVGGGGGDPEVVGERQVVAVDAGEPAGEADTESLERWEGRRRGGRRGRRAAARLRCGTGSGRRPRRSSRRTCRSGRATTRCPCPGSGEALGCGGRPPARPRDRRERARRRSGRPLRRRRRRAPAPPGSGPGCGRCSV